jgi:predicted alpha/beta-fold hydrolase
MSYRAPRWLPGGHLQTIYASLWAPRPQVAYRRERWDTPDGDFIELDWIGAQPGRPLTVMFHGLEGNSQSQYSLALMAALARREWNGVIVHFRGCSGAPNLKLRAYHSGDAPEADWILRRLRERQDSPMFAAGVSLGGNVLAKWLGEQGDNARSIVNAAAAVSSPLDLAAGGHALGRGFNMIYTRMFLKTLKHKSLAKLSAFPGAFDAAAVLNSKTLYEFDNVVTAPLHGFRDTDDYWSRAAGKPLLRGIRVPTLLLNAKNDPFVPAASLPTPADVSPSVVLEQPEEGGHCGFVSGAFPGNLEWLPQRLLAFFDQQLQAR